LHPTGLPVSICSKLVLSNFGAVVSG
jgi:hypothetical protein